MYCPMKFNIYTLDVNGRVADQSGCQCDLEQCACYDKERKSCGLRIKNQGSAGETKG